MGCQCRMPQHPPDACAPEGIGHPPIRVPPGPAFIVNIKVGGRSPRSPPGGGGTYMPPSVEGTSPRAVYGFLSRRYPLSPAVPGSFPPA
jgi:hypothetical protein